MSTPAELEELLLEHLKASAEKGVRLHGPKCTSHDCIDPFADYHGGQLPMSCATLARKVNEKAHKSFTSDDLYGFLLGFEDGPLIDTADPNFYALGQKLRRAYEKGFK